MKKLKTIVVILASVLFLTGCTSGGSSYTSDGESSYTSESKKSNYICSYNAYNCGDFSTHSEAMAVYLECGGVNNDVHQLDRDKDGSACETLP